MTVLLLVACASDGAAGPPTPTPTVPPSQLVPKVEPSQIDADEMLISVRGSDLWLVPFRGEAQKLTEFKPSDLLADPVWSPDGRTVAFTRLSLMTGQRELPGADLDLLDVETRTVTTLIAHDRPGAQIMSPAWISDDELLFVYYAPIYENNIPTGAIRELRRFNRVTGEAQTVMTGTMAVGLSADRETMAYVQSSGSSSELYVASLDGESPTLLVPAGMFTEIAVPRPSPDGSQIVFAAVGRPEGADFPPAPPEPQTSASPWSLGELLAPRTAEAHGIPWDVWIVNRDGTGLRALTNLNEDTPTPSWFPDGRQIVFQAETATYLLDAETRWVGLLLDAGGYGGSDLRPRRTP